MLRSSYRFVAAGCLWLLASGNASARVIQFENVQYSYVVTTAGNGYNVNDVVANATITGSFDYTSTINNSNSGTWGDVSVTFSNNATSQNGSTFYDRAYVSSPTGISGVSSFLFFWNSNGLLPVTRITVAEFLNNTTAIYNLVQTSPTTYNTFCANVPAPTVLSGNPVTCGGGTSRVNMTALSGQMVPSPGILLGIAPVIFLTKKRRSLLSAKNSLSLSNDI